MQGGKKLKYLLINKNDLFRGLRRCRVTKNVQSTKKFRDLQRKSSSFIRSIELLKRR